MAGKPAVQVSGAKELRKALEHMEGGLSDLKDANLAAARVVADEAQNLVPRRSGTLAHTLQPKATKASGSVTGGRGILYAGVIHFGWPQHNIKPQPFLFDALDKRRDQVVSVYTHRVDDLVRRLDQETPG